VGCVHPQNKSHTRRGPHRLCLFGGVWPGRTDPRQRQRGQDRPHLDRQLTHRWPMGPRPPSLTATRDSNSLRRRRTAQRHLSATSTQKLRQQAFFDAMTEACNRRVRGTRPSHASETSRAMILWAIRGPQLRASGGRERARVGSSDRGHPGHHDVERMGVAYFQTDGAGSIPVARSTPRKSS
jgi:hypothetical protein